MRTQEQFLQIWKEMAWFVKFHNKPIWIVPRETDYTISVIRPTPSELPYGTRANLYDMEHKIIDSVGSKMKITT